MPQTLFFILSYILTQVNLRPLLIFKIISFLADAIQIELLVYIHEKYLQEV